MSASRFESPPRGDALRAAAARVVAAVADQGESLDTTLATQQAQFGDSRDRALLATLVYGTLRWHPRSEFLIARMLSRPIPARDREIHALLAVGLHQLEFLRIPPHAAVHATVEAAARLGRPHSRGLVNAVLRRYQRERDALLAAVQEDPVARYAHPAWLVDRLFQEYPDQAHELLTAGNAAPPLWLRVNRLHVDRDAYRARLAQAGLAAHTHPEAVDALRLETPVDVTELPGFAEGDVSVQDAAAQLAVEYLDLTPGLRLLDACAAPGGKTAHVLERYPDVALVTAVDHAQSRLAMLSENLARLHLEADIRHGDVTDPAAWWDGVAYDRILLDAPCSATGVIRRHPDIKLRRDPQQVTVAAQAQRAMLDALWPLLAPGGRLVYATCSLLAEENEEQVRAFLDRKPQARLLSPGTVDAPGRRIPTGEQDMDGFYYACLQKSTDL